MLLLCLACDCMKITNIMGLLSLCFAFNFQLMREWLFMSVMSWTTWDSLRCCLFCDLYCSLSQIPVIYLYIILPLWQKDRYRIYWSQNAFHLRIECWLCVNDRGCPASWSHVCYIVILIDLSLWLDSVVPWERVVLASNHPTFKKTIQQHIIGIKIVPNLYMLTSNQTP